MFGTVTKYFRDKGYGFIRGQNGKSYFIHKDYFFTMDVLKEKGFDNAVGRDGVFDLMWDYMNKDLREFTVFYMSCMSVMYKQQTGVGIAEKFCEDNGIGTYTMDRENGLVIDNQNGGIAKVSNKPSFMSVVK